MKEMFVIMYGSKKLKDAQNTKLQAGKQINYKANENAMLYGKVAYKNTCSNIIHKN